MSTEDVIPADHPIPPIPIMVDAVRGELADTFDAMYAVAGRRNVPPQTLLKSTVLMAIYSIPSERAFWERLNYDLLSKRFLDMRIDQPGVRRHRPLSRTASGCRPTRWLTSFRRCRAPGEAVPLPLVGSLLRRLHVVGGEGVTPELQTQGPPARAAPPAGRNVETQWHGEKRSNESHASTTEPELRPARKGNTAARCATPGHLLMEHCNALIVDAELTAADGYAGRARPAPTRDPTPHGRWRQGRGYSRVQR